jgi:TonB family protein
MPRNIAIHVVRPVCALLLSLPCLHVAAQSSSPATAPAPSERAQRDADKVFQMILLHRDRKSPVKAPAREATAAAKPFATPATPSMPSTPVTTRDALITTASAPNTPNSLVPNVAASTAPGSAAQAEPNSSPAAVPTAPAAAADSPRALAVSTVSELKTDLPISALPALATAEAALPMPAVPLPVVPALPAPPPRLELVSAVEPEFPSRLVRTLGTGSVVVNFVVAADGRVATANAVSSSHKGLEPAAIAAVLQWRFKAMSGPANGTTELKFE